MREIGRQRRLRRLVTIGLAAMVAIAVGGSLAATQAQAASTKPAAAGLSLSRQFFGTAFDKYAGHNLPVFRYTLRNNRGMSVKIITYGATVQAINVPDRFGRVADVVLGFDTLDSAALSGWGEANHQEARQASAGKAQRNGRQPANIRPCVCPCD